MRIRIRIQHFWSVQIRIQIWGFEDQKLEKNLQQKIFYLILKKFFKQKLLFTFPYGSKKDVHATEEAFSPQKENI